MYLVHNDCHRLHSLKWMYIHDSSPFFSALFLWIPMHGSRRVDWLSLSWEWKCTLGVTVFHVEENMWQPFLSISKLNWPLRSHLGPPQLLLWDPRTRNNSLSGPVPMLSRDLRGRSSRSHPPAHSQPAFWECLAWSRLGVSLSSSHAQLNAHEGKTDPTEQGQWWARVCSRQS